MLAAWPFCTTDQLAGLMGGVTHRSQITYWHSGRRYVLHPDVSFQLSYQGDWDWCLLEYGNDCLIWPHLGPNQTIIPSSVSGPEAPAARTRVTVSRRKWAAPRTLWARPLRSRAISTSPEPAATASSG